MSDKTNELISTEDYYLHHENEQELHGIDDSPFHVPDDYVQHVQCCSCPAIVPADEILTIGYDDLCIPCAKNAEVYRCLNCGIVFEMSDKCPECGWEREK